MKKIVFSILNRNGLGDTIHCIDSLLESDYQDFHIYVLDNGSKDKNEFDVLCSKYRSNAHITLNRSNTNLGFTGGNNLNLGIMTQDDAYDCICLLNNDCIVSEKFLGDLIAHISSCDIDAIYGPIIRNSNGTIQSCGSMINLWLGTNPRLQSIDGVSQEVDCVSGSCFVISKKIFENIGYLDDQYFAYREESDYCIRAKKAGYKILSMNIEGITHKEEIAGSKKKPYYAYLMFRNRILFLKKHANIVQYFVSWFVLIVYMIVIFPRVFGLSNLRYALSGVMDGILGRGGAM